jgi:hypothetical protein
MYQDLKAENTVHFFWEMENIVLHMDGHISLPDFDFSFWHFADTFDTYVVYFSNLLLCLIHW